MTLFGWLIVANCVVATWYFSGWLDELDSSNVLVKVTVRFMVTAVIILLGVLLVGLILAFTARERRALRQRKEGVS